MPWPGWLLSPWPPLLISPVFTHPLDAKTAAGGGKVMRGWGGGRYMGGGAWGGSVQSTLEEVSGRVPRGLPGFIWPLIPSLMLCPELFHYGMRGSVSTPHLFPSSLMTSVPDPRTDPSLCPGKSVSSYSGQGEGPGGCTVLLVGLHHSALFICVIIFLKKLYYLWLPPPCPSLGSSLSSRPACTSLGCSRVPCPLFQPWLSGPASKGHDPAACPKHLFMEERRGLICRKLEPRALGKGTLHDIPLPALHQAEGPVFPDVLTPFNVPNGPSPRACAPSAVRAPSPKTCSPCVRPLCPLQ